MTGIFSVLTGDIVRSGDLGRARLTAVMRALESAGAEIARWSDPAGPAPERFRGDGWQLALVEPHLALRACLVLRAAIRKLDRDADTRIGIGFGSAEFGKRLASSRGTAFEFSGDQLERLSGPDRWSADGDLKPAPLRELTRGLFAACEGLSAGWTVRQAEVCYRLVAPDEPKMVDVAAALDVRPQTVQDHFARAGGRALMHAVHAFERAFG